MRLSSQATQKAEIRPVGQGVDRLEWWEEFVRPYLKGKKQGVVVHSCYSSDPYIK
jgi:hypothetical protein